MATLQIELDDDMYRRLETRARERGLTVEDVAVAAVANEAQMETVSPEVAAIIERQLEQYGSVFHRLAQ